MTSRFLPILAILFAVALTFIYIRPTYNGVITDTKTRIGSYDAALAAAERFAQKEAQLTQARAAIAPESLARLNAFLPDGVDNVQLILDLDALAARSGITLSNFTVSGQDGGSPGSGGPSSAARPTLPGAAPAGPVSAPTAPVGTAVGALPGAVGGLGLQPTSPIDSVDLTLTATGSYNSFRKFLAGMEQSLRPLDVISIKVSQSNTGVYTYAMTIRIYWLR